MTLNRNLIVISVSINSRFNVHVILSNLTGHYLLNHRYVPLRSCLIYNSNSYNLINYLQWHNYILCSNTFYTSNIIFSDIYNRLRCTVLLWYLISEYRLLIIDTPNKLNRVNDTVFSRCICQCKRKKKLKRKIKANRNGNQRIRLNIFESNYHIFELNCSEFAVFFYFVVTVRENLSRNSFRIIQWTVCLWILLQVSKRTLLKLSLWFSFFAHNGDNQFNVCGSSNRFFSYFHPIRLKSFRLTTAHKVVDSAVYLSRMSHDKRIRLTYDFGFVIIY